MLKLTQLTIVSLCVFLSACEQKKTTKPRADLLPYSFFNLDLPESIFVEGRGLCVDDNYIYVGERSNSINKYTHEGKLGQVFGGSGQGPGEFSNLTNLAIREDLVFALDRYLFINVFDNQGAFVQKITLQASSPATRMAVDESMNVYLSTPGLSEPIGVYDLNGNFLRGFGTWLGEHTEPIQRSEENARFLSFNRSGNLVSLSAGSATIEIYSPEGKLLRQRKLAYDPTFIAFTKKVENFFRENPKRLKDSTFQLAHDATLINDKLLFRHVGDDKTSNNLFIIDVSGDQIGEGVNYKIKGRDGGSITCRFIAAHGSTLFVYDSARNLILKYKLPPELIGRGS
ncbi:MAG: hypothetical protein QNK37_22530 [Acidobacteriota bacterium]|nr:hypothetical protein [Acidobacteriota bacterium]